MNKRTFKQLLKQRNEQAADNAQANQVVQAGQASDGNPSESVGFSSFIGGDSSLRLGQSSISSDPHVNKRKRRSHTGSPSFPVNIQVAPDGLDLFARFAEDVFEKSPTGTTV